MMGRMPWMMYFWPGLPRVWRRGAWRALVVSIGAAALLNLLLLATFLWEDLVTPPVRLGGWVVAAMVWVAAGAIARWDDLRRRAAEGSVRTSDTLPQVIEHYLKGSWFEAECGLVDLLQRNPRDVDAAIMLLGLLRHTRRYEEALTLLDRLQRLEGIEKWGLELFRERRWLEAAMDGSGGSKSPAQRGLSAA